MPIPPNKLVKYRSSDRQREQKRRQQQTLRQQSGWRVAEQAAEVLKRERVRLFGSLLEVRHVHSQSDVDLAVDGLADSLYLKAVARLLDLSDFSVDLVQMEYARPRLPQVIEEHGVEL